MEDRDGKLASSPSVLAAIGAMGHDLLHIEDADQRVAVKAALIKKLRAVDWSRGKHWEGIAGQIHAQRRVLHRRIQGDGLRDLGALSDDTSPALSQVRPALTAAA